MVQSLRLFLQRRLAAEDPARRTAWYSRSDCTLQSRRRPVLPTSPAGRWIIRNAVWTMN